MLSVKMFDQIYIFRPFVDFRKGIDGLSGIIQEVMELSPFEKYLFIFCARSRDKIKMLYWDETGFVMWYKRLECEKFSWPSHLEEKSIGVKALEVDRFLKGLNPWQIPHKKLHFSSI